MSTRRSTAELASRLPESVWAERLAAADRESALLEQVLSRVRDGSSRSEALRQVFPEKLVSSMLKRLCRYEAGGRDGLLNRQLPVRGVRKVDEEARGVLRVLALTHPEAGSVWLARMPHKGIPVEPRRAHEVARPASPLTGTPAKASQASPVGLRISAKNDPSFWESENLLLPGGIGPCTE